MLARVRGLQQAYRQALDEENGKAALALRLNERELYLVVVKAAGEQRAAIDACIEGAERPLGQVGASCLTGIPRELCLLVEPRAGWMRTTDNIPALGLWRRERSRTRLRQAGVGSGRPGYF